MFFPGLVSVSFRGLSPKEIIELCRQNGLYAIEWGSDVHLPVRDIKKAEKISKECKAFGIDPFAYGSYYRLSERTVDFSDYLNTAAALGAKVIRIWAGTKSPKDTSKEEYFRLVDEAGEIADLSKSFGITVATECHVGTMTENYTDTLRFLNDVGQENFRTYWQPNQFKSFEENIEAAKALSPFTVGIHVFNWDDRRRYPLCEGHEQWNEYLNIFKCSDIPLMLEFMHDDRPESLPSTAQTLKDFIEGVNK